LTGRRPLDWPRVRSGTHPDRAAPIGTHPDRRRERGNTSRLAGGLGGGHGDDGGRSGTHPDPSAVVRVHVLDVRGPIGNTSRSVAGPIGGRQIGRRRSHRLCRNRRNRLCRNRRSALDDLVHGRALGGTCLKHLFLLPSHFLALLPDFRFCLTQIRLSL